MSFSFTRHSQCFSFRFIFLSFPLRQYFLAVSPNLVFFFKFHSNVFLLLSKTISHAEFRSHSLFSLKFFSATSICPPLSLSHPCLIPTHQFSHTLSLSSPLSYHHLAIARIFSLFLYFSNFNIYQSGA